MISSSSSRASLLNVGIEGSLMALAPLPFLLAGAGTVDQFLGPWRLIASSAAAFFCLLTAMLLLRRSLPGKIFGYLAIAACGIAGLPYFATEPLNALFGGVILIQFGYFLREFGVRQRSPLVNSPVDRSLQRARGALWIVPPMALFGFFLHSAEQAMGDYAIVASMLISQGMVAHWIWRRHKGILRMAWTSALLVAATGGCVALLIGQAGLAALFLSLLVLAIIPRSHAPLEYHENWWEPFLNHPARVLISTFLGLCVLGTLLLQLPWASAKGYIAPVDAAFTSVSAVCVTGLIVLDTPNDFTLLGQGFILMLIQLGGFGIMTISTVALHVMGKRLSLRQERLLTTLTETSHSNLISSLVMIVRFTFLAELAGTVLLTGCFLNAGEPFSLSVWKGLFTSISAFCNAGFSLQSDNLISFQTNPFLLHTVAALIVLGGLAPATCLLLPAWIKGRAIPLAPRIAIVTTASLLLAGTVCFLVFEWDNALAALSITDKLHNAWFQSVTLRTAGFNSVDINGVLGSTFLVMLSFMFIGGSPGGTAGGIKTTTIGVLAMTFWSSITGHNEVIAQNRRIPQNTINRAVTVVGSGVMVWFIAVLALQITQHFPAREVVFEVTSALGTVGLSLGATPHLDGIGKIIVMLTMFIGRIGPTTLFTLLSWDVAPTDSRCPDARISLN